MSELQEQLIDLLNAEAIFLRQQLAEERLRRAETLAMCDQLMKERDEAEAERIEWVQRGERAEQQLATMTQERDQWKQGHNDAVRVGLEYQRQLAEAVRIAKELTEPSPVTEADVKWAQDMLAAQQHQEGLP